MMLTTSSVLGFPRSKYEEDQPLQDSAKEEVALDIMEKVRCMVCKGQTVKDSDSRVAKTLRILIRRKVDAGATEEEIRGEITEMYSDWIYIDPKLDSSTIVLWFGPFLALGTFCALFALRGRK